MLSARPSKWTYLRYAVEAEIVEIIRLFKDVWDGRRP